MKDHQMSYLFTLFFKNGYSGIQINYSSSENESFYIHSIWKLGFVHIEMRERQIVLCLKQDSLYRQVSPSASASQC